MSHEVGSGGNELGAWVDDHLEHLRLREYNAEALVNSGRVLRDLAAFAEDRGIASWTRIGERDLTDYVELLAGRAHAPVYLANQVVIVRVFFQGLTRRGKLLANPAADLPIPKFTPGPVEILTVREVNRLMKAPDVCEPTGCRDRLVLEVLYGLGVRTAELCAMDIGDVDLDEGMARIHGKGAKERVLPVSPQLQELLRGFLDRVRARFEPRGNLLLPASRGGRLCSKTINFHIIQEHAARAGVKKHVKALTLRHTIATHLLERGADIRHVQAFLGHERLASTQRYTHVSVKALRRMMRRCHPRERRECVARESEILESLAGDQS